jgi:nucleotide-binding universal stress UspA family protein
MDAATPTPRGAPSSTYVIMVASTGEAIDRRVLDRAVQLAGELPSRPVMHVLSIARVWGTALGLQNPGLYPTRKEWQAQVDLVADAVKALKGRGFDARGRVVGSRHASKTIGKVAVAEGCEAIVIGAVPTARWRRLLRQDEADNLFRRSAVPVYVVDVSM